MSIIMSGPNWERDALNSATTGAAQASEADTIMRDHDESSEGGSFVEEDSDFSEDGCGFAEVGAELIPNHHQFAADDASEEDGSWFQPDTDQSSEEYVHMEDDDEDEEGEGGLLYDDNFYILHIVTIKKELLQPFVDHLVRDVGPVGAWLSACQELPGVQGLADVKRLHPTALPSWLALEAYAIVLPYLSVRAGNRVVFNGDSEADTQARAAEREAQLGRFIRCRFQEGFASEGMLCNSPPLPLRVLDYLEAADLISLSLVCKATHQASHYLFRHEEEVLNRPDIETLGLEHLSRYSPPDYSKTAVARHRAMRAASLMCGRPEAVDVTEMFPSLLHDLVTSPDACTQPHVSWEFRYNHSYDDLTKILEGRRVKEMGGGWTVDPVGWPRRDQKAIEKLWRKVRQNFDGDEEVIDNIVERAVRGVGRVFKAAREHGQAVFMFQEELHT